LGPPFVSLTRREACSTSAQDLPQPLTLFSTATMSGAAVAAPKKASKNAHRRAQKKAKRAVSLAPLCGLYDILSVLQETPSEAGDSARESESPAPDDKTNNDAQAVRAASLNLDDIPDQYDFDNPLFEQYKSVFEKFREHTAEEVAKEDDKPEIYYEEDEIPDEEDETSKKLSKRQRKEMNKLTVAQLKSMVKKPELVEWTDVSSPDPCLLIAIKGYKNVVPVPNHWSLKREYLSSKRGIEKPPFQLPKFIQETGISEMRDAVLEKQAEMTMKQKQRERVQGKIGKLDIDYGKLYDAFFRRQTKPEMTRYGEVYYEGKEFETSLVHLKPGVLSDELKDALGMGPGHPPPWLINQQNNGPPPSYPNLQIPGVNAPIPPGASWGFSPGQWGKPPLDEHTQLLRRHMLVRTRSERSGVSCGKKVIATTRRIVTKKRTRMQKKMKVKMMLRVYVHLQHQQPLCLLRWVGLRPSAVSLPCANNVKESRRKSLVRHGAPTKFFQRRISRRPASLAASMHTILMLLDEMPLGITNGNERLVILRCLSMWTCWRIMTRWTRRH
jgi:hypothetical protein